MMLELHKRLEISISLSNPKPILDEMEDEDFTQLRSTVVGDRTANNIQVFQHIIYLVRLQHVTKYLSCLLTRVLQ